MSARGDGGPAFPVGSGDMRDPTGMSLRDWFAGMALQGILASSGRLKAADAASDAYLAADMMLARRSK